MRSRILLSLMLLVAIVGVGCTQAGRTTPGEAVVLAAPATATERPIDSEALAAALDAAGVDLPDGAGVYAARLDDAGATMDEYEAGDGAEASDFWPASSVKVLAAEGALAYLATMGFTGAARITMGGETFRVADVYDAAISDSSNEAYDRLVQIAGVDWLNTQFLTAANGFAATVIQRSYTGDGVRLSPAMRISEGGRTESVPTRRASGTYDCPDDGNCSTLLDLAESVRVVVSGDSDLAPADVDGLEDALLDAEGFVEPAVETVLGPSSLVYNKPGYVPGDACVDVAVVADGDERYLVGIATPDDGPTCPALVTVAAVTLGFLEDIGRA